MAGSFYDKVARKFGASGTKVKCTSEYPEGDPEKVFEQKMLELSGRDKIALDLGCGSGEFTLQMSSHFRQVVGIDSSEERLKHAQAEKQVQGNRNVRFEMQNAGQTSFVQDTFDVLYSRRGPTFYRECYRIMRQGGHVIVVGIGEKDAWELKRVFGRGQGFRDWQTTTLEQDFEQQQQAGFSVVYGQDVRYDEYYASYADLDLFLQGVPIFEDFDSGKDKPLLEMYVAAFQTDKGIHLPRHRLVTVALKP